MQKKYKILWTNVAEEDLANIIKYIAHDNPSNTLNILKTIKEKASTLYRSPEKGRIVPELQEQGILQYCELIIPPWRMIYRVSEKNIYFLSVLDSRQNIEDILFRRVINLER